VSLARHPSVTLCVCVSAALVSAVKVMCCIQCSLIYLVFLCLLCFHWVTRLAIARFQTVCFPVMYGTVGASRLVLSLTDWLADC